MANPFSEELQRRQNPFQTEMQRRQQLPAIIPNGAARPSDMFSQQLIPGVPGTRVSTVGARDTGAFNAALRAAGSQAIENVLGIPDLLVSQGNPANLAQLTRGEDIVPLPSGRDVVAGVETAAEVPGALLDDQPLQLRQRFAEQQRQALQSAQQHPLATTVGGVFGDAGTIATGRVPARGLTRALLPRVPPAGVARNASRIRTARPGFRNVLNRASNKLTDSLGRGALRAGEAGLEGATLALLQKGDPVQTAAFAAGSQAAGSLILTATGAVRKRPLSSTFLALLLGHQLFKAVGPGERNLFESSDEAINEIIAGYGLGILARLAGTGRVPRSGFARNFPETVTDSLTAIPRGALTSLWEDLARDENEILLPVVERYATGGFNDNQRRRIERAFKNGRLKSEVDKLMEVPSFREALDGVDSE